MIDPRLLILLAHILVERTSDVEFPLAVHCMRFCFLVERMSRSVNVSIKYLIEKKKIEQFVSNEAANFARFLTS